MQVDNSKEDIIQYALGIMSAYSISVSSHSDSKLSWAKCYAGIIVQTHVEALIKVLKRCPNDIQENILQVSKCE